MYDVAGEKSQWVLMQAFCADVEVVEHEGGGTMVEDVMLEIAVINVAHST